MEQTNWLNKAFKKGRIPFKQALTTMRTLYNP